jgi:hypothetical protein
MVRRFSHLLAVGRGPPAGGASLNELDGVRTRAPHGQVAGAWAALADTVANGFSRRLVF